MADLLDIAPSVAVQSVYVDGRHIIVRGLNGDALASIVSRFPKLTAILDGAEADFGPKLLAQFGSAMAPIIAAGCDHLNDEKYETAAANLLVEDQLKLIKAIAGLTFRNGLSSFVETLRDFLAPDEGAKEVKMRLKQSPSPSQPSSAEDSRQTMQ